MDIAHGEIPARFVDAEVQQLGVGGGAFGEGEHAEMLDRDCRRLLPNAAKCG
ncbi:hypothetical protein D3C78_1824600 [compost metagenome]